MKRSMPASSASAEVPFSSERKLMSTVHTDAERQERLLVFTKGAPDMLLGALLAEAGRRGNAAADRGAPRGDSEGNEELAGEALRTLGVAYRVAARRCASRR